ncbi:MAG: type I glyceraldehyde-3-phosphate dehydrogenase [Candidatus Levybacteria bacterium]|nr:type I glyceraldehyde-3-phosphate dehydrogenase [Candidatus Levybacteria bacterium]
MVRVAINGYGRIGRIAHRVILQKYKEEIQVVAVNAGSSTDLAGWKYLLKYDSVYGALPIPIEVEEKTSDDPENFLGKFLINNEVIAVYSQKDPQLLPWKDLQIDVVIESTGAFETREGLEKHIQAGARKVVLSAPAKDDVETIVLGVNELLYKGERVLSNASCTTNCIAPVAKVMHEQFGIEKAMLTTVHGYTSDQRLQDGGHKDYRRARAAGLNIVPTSTGATKTLEKTIPELGGRFSGVALRVPVPVGSLSDFTFLLSRSTTKEEVNDTFKRLAASPEFSHILEVTEDPLVSSDIIGNPHSAIVDLSLTQVVGGNMVKVVAWYDNEYGYANRLVEEVLLAAS